MIISIDDGSNFTKIAFHTEEKTQTEAFASRVIRSALPSMDGLGYSAASYEIDGQKYAVAQSSGETVPTNNLDFQTSDANRVLINHALRMVGHSEKLDIVLTLPVSQFFNPDGTKNAALIENKISNAKGEIKYLDSASPVSINQCFVLPEGLPAFAYAKSQLNLPNGQYLIADIGGTTTDLILFDEDNQIQKFMSVQVGALNMLSNFAQSVKSQLNLNDLPDKHALNGLLSGVVAGEDVGQIAKQVLTAFEARVMDSVNNMGDVRLFDGVIFSGGGSQLLNGDFVDVVKTDNPRFDNALGALDIMGG